MDRTMMATTPPTPSTPTTEAATETSPTSEHRPFRDVTISFAVDVSGSTAGTTLNAEKTFIQNVTNVLSAPAQDFARILPWNHSAHPVQSLAGLGTLSSHGMTNPQVLLANPSHKASLQRSQLWFLMTDGLIDGAVRARFANDVAVYGIHGLSCVVVVFGHPRKGPASCDISVGVSVFAVVPNCAFLFCNASNGELRIMQTKGTFDVLLRGKPPPDLGASARWDSLPSVSEVDFADVAIPPPQQLHADHIAVDDSLVIDMNDVFANKLNLDQTTRIFSNPANMASVRLTMQSRGQEQAFQHWVHQQAIPQQDPLYKPRTDRGAKAQSSFMEVVNFSGRGELPPPILQARLRAAYRENMKHFIREMQGQTEMSTQRKAIIREAAAQSAVPVHASENLQQTTLKTSPGSGGSPSTAFTPTSSSFGEQEEEPWGSWETRITPPSLRGLMYTPGVRSSRGSFTGACPLCGAIDITLAWVFRDPFFGIQTSAAQQNVGAGLPQPGSHSQFHYPLAMGIFPGTSGILGPLSSNSSFSTSPHLHMPPLVCDPCSVFCTSKQNNTFGVTASLPLVRFTENSEAVFKALGTAFSGRFADADLPQVFLAVLVQAAIKSPPNADDVITNTFRAALEWTVQDLLHSVMASPGPPNAFPPGHAAPSAGPLGSVITTLFKEFDASSYGAVAPPLSPLLRYPLPGIVVILRVAPLLHVSVESRRRAVFGRLLYLLCEKVAKTMGQEPYSQTLTNLFLPLLRQSTMTPSDPTAAPAVPQVDQENNISISIQSLMSTGLLARTNYSILRQSEEFQHLENTLVAAWVGPAIALFLHVLYWVASNRSSMDAPATFKAVMNMGHLGNMLLRPEEISEGVVRQFLLQSRT